MIVRLKDDSNQNYERILTNEELKNFLTDEEMKILLDYEDDRYDRVRDRFCTALETCITHPYLFGLVGRLPEDFYIDTIRK